MFNKIALVRVTFVVLTAVGLIARFLTSPAGASEAVLGAGSSWAFPAVSAWQADVARQNLTVNYNDDGSAAGRTAFYDDQTDFTVSDIPFQAQNCPPPGSPAYSNGTCAQELLDVQQSGRTFQYMPIVAGGTSIMYHITINGQEFRGLKLDSETVTKIFTGVITKWNDPEIAANNPGVPLPNEPINVVVRSDGSGASWELSNYFVHTQPALWDAFGRAMQLNPPNGPTEYYPQDNSHFQAYNGSDQEANQIASASGEGDIGYDETAYALENNIPIASIKNQAGVYTQPSAVNVAVALTAAELQPDHTELLNNVYTMPDPRAYPISSYSYIIAPTNTTGHWQFGNNPFNTSKGQTLGKFINYLLCQGQQEAQPLGYSPLPPNLVEIGFNVEHQIPGGVATPSIYACNNPTITGCWLNVNHIPAAPACLTNGRGAPVRKGATAAAAAGSASTAAGHGGGAGAAGSAAGNATSAGTTASSAAAGTATTAGKSQQVASGALASGQQANGLRSSGSNGSPAVVSGKNVSFGKPWSSATTDALIAAAALLIVLAPPAVALFRKRYR